jgi:hypothetical protein
LENETRDINHYVYSYCFDMTHYPELLKEEMGIERGNDAPYILRYEVCPSYRDFHGDV